jgi:hypothetical protein
VRVFVTAEAPLEFEVRLAHMTVGALRDGFLDGRRMTGMTACAPDVLMFASGCGYISRRSSMTFHTVVV